MLIISGLFLISHGMTHVVDGYVKDEINVDLILLGLAWVGIGLFPIGIGVQILFFYPKQK